MPRKRLAPIKPALLTRARVAELADALASGASDRKVVEVRVLSRAPIFLNNCDVTGLTICAGIRYGGSSERFIAAVRCRFVSASFHVLISCVGAAFLVPPRRLRK